MRVNCHAVVYNHTLSMGITGKAHLQPGQSCLRNTRDAVNFFKTLVEKEPVEDNFGKAEVIWLVIRIEIVQRNNYGTPHRAAPDGNRERKVNYVGCNLIGELRQFSYIPHVSRESVIGNIDRN